MYKNQQNPDQIELKFEGFTHPFSNKLNHNNRWVKMADLIPWADFECHYAEQMSAYKGASALPFRTALGSLLVKEKLGLSDRDTMEHIIENPYIQYFIGLPSFKLQAPFDHSMFTHFRKRIQLNIIQHINEEIISEHLNNTEDKKVIVDVKVQESIQVDENVDIVHDESQEITQSENLITEETVENKGKLLIDATCAPSDIRYPTDLSLLNEAREKTEEIIDILWGYLHAKSKGELKPRTYRKRGRKEFLAIIKLKRKSKSILKKTKRKQLEYIRRNLESINMLKSRVSLCRLKKQTYTNLLVISELYRQQLEMYRENKFTISNRIVSISQPHVRPIVRGKAASPVEFGAKISISDVNGFVYLDRLEWEAYHEGADLIIQAESYKNRYGCWPISIHADKAYQNRANRKWCQERNIRLTGSSPGRPAKVTDANKAEIEMKKKQRRQDEIDRIAIEGKFGVAKRRYGLSRIMAKLKETSETVIGIPFLVMNLDKILRDLFCHFLYMAKNLNFSFKIIFRNFQIRKIFLF